ncbi:hypothetical protein PPL_12325 [Heterostelium album PN500]|uniref:CEMIP domain-containing protein n=1 Tax=Heterostelium pallidum (strain ATCC 26659 / Pp 5 / PN500) TaxID=670386 RepID=D3BMB5_HETP5|nr:hypothetical protein PPL_12325 [Heterostelium album PN500]EFA77716.1 hypothetical protein PPL_12325 [Heterostelium album PN500]|eukprot:XP_020429844.1 hypothetical protein PPL_12325 [Heterostelium album PN500]
MHFSHPSPPQLRLQMTNFDQGDTIVVGVCYPTWGVNFVVQRNLVYGWHTVVTNMTQGNSIADVNNDVQGNTWYYDQRTGLLFLRFTQLNARPWTQYCPLEGCESLNIVASGSGMGTNTGDCSGAAYGTGTYAKMEYATRGGCNGSPELEYDSCGICGGNGSLCAKGTNDINASTKLIISTPLLSLIFILTLCILL